MVKMASQDMVACCQIYIVTMTLTDLKAYYNNQSQLLAWISLPARTVLSRSAAQASAKTRLTTKHGCDENEIRHFERRSI